MIARAVTDLPEPEFAHQPEGLAARDREGHAVHRGEIAAPQAETHGQVVELKYRLGHAQRSASRGSRMSRRPSPNRLKASTV